VYQAYISQGTVRSLSCCKPQSKQLPFFHNHNNNKYFIPPAIASVKHASAPHHHTSQQESNNLTATSCQKTTHPHIPKAISDNHHQNQKGRTLRISHDEYLSKTRMVMMLSDMT
jgi:hypothetical protein